MIQGAVDSVRANHDSPSKLDSATGDGDHGAAMLRSVEAVAKALKDGAASAPKDLLYNIGWAVMHAAGGATGPLLGSLFVGLSEGLGEQADVDTAGLAGMFEAALASVQKQTKARPVDKTMMDALVPAVAAIRAVAGAAVGVEVPSAGRRRRPARGRVHPADAGQVRQGPQPRPADHRPAGPRRHLDRLPLPRFRGWNNDEGLRTREIVHELHEWHEFCRKQQDDPSIGLPAFPS